MMQQYLRWSCGFNYGIADLEVVYTFEPIRKLLWS